MEPFQSWPEGDDYAKKLFNLYVGINVLASLPVAFVTSPKYGCVGPYLGWAREF